MTRDVTDRLLHRHCQRHTARAIDRASERHRSARVPVVRGGDGNGDEFARCAVMTCACARVTRGVRDAQRAWRTVQPPAPPPPSPATVPRHTMCTKHDDAEDHNGRGHGRCHGHGHGRDVGPRRARARCLRSLVWRGYTTRDVRRSTVPRRRRRRSRARAPQRHLCEWARTIEVGSGGGSWWVRGRSL